ncbi:sensor histidine kinase [Paenibacillus azoreducens]|uniref:histidine kinase n=1 Tax=Paenibacillus azoreducens TaxID=116718 RepID=A0A919YEY0_9BACL|nr:sensor histidine kinase [Paenibacillus azoreducens]GIO49952.1 histidine kinase [Paenibacillus azoreducens]
MSRWMKNIKFGAVFMVLLALVAYLANVIINQRDMGIGVTLNSDNQVVITSLETDGWGQEVLEPGDIVLKVDGSNPLQTEMVRQYGVIESADNITVNRIGSDGTLRTLWFPVTHGASAHGVLFYLVIPGASLLLLLVFSGYVYWKEKNDHAAQMLILFFLSIGLSYFSSAASGLLDPVGRTTLGFSFAYIPVFFVHFMQAYLRRFQEEFVSRAGLRFLYILAFLIGVLMTLSVIPGIPIHPLETASLLVFFICSNFFIVYKLILKFVKHRSGDLKSLFKFTLTGHAVAFLPFLLFDAIPGFFDQSFVPAKLTAIFLLAIPIVYFYLFITKRLFDIDFVLNRFSYYTTISFVPALVIIGLMALTMHQNQYTWLKWIQIFLLVYLMITLFLFAKEFMDYRLRPHFLKETHDFQGSIDRFSKRISKVMKRSDLEQALEREVCLILPVRNISFLKIVQDINMDSTAVTGDGRAAAGVEDTLQKLANKPALGDMLRMPQGVGLVIGNYGTTQHIMWIDEKVNHTSLNLDERNWLKTIAHYSGIVYENLYLIEGLIGDLEMEMKNQKEAPSWVLRLIFTLSENERRRLASDLHDAALQDQLIWYRKLESLMLDYPMEEGLVAQLEQIKEGLLDVIHQIRQTCNELRPPLLKEMGIVEALEQLIQQEQIRSNYSVKLWAEPTVIELNDVQILAVYRIVQELLRNADKHARASQIFIRLEQRDDELCFYYKDDGRGMNLTELTDSFKHMGISGIKERVRSLDGEITFNSEPGKGFEVRLTLPLDAHSEEGGVSDGSYFAG